MGLLKEANLLIVKRKLFRRENKKRNRLFMDFVEISWKGIFGFQN